MRAAYNYAEHLPERRRMMQAWADYLDELKEAARGQPKKQRAAAWVGKSRDHFFSVSHHFGLHTELKRFIIDPEARLFGQNRLPRAQTDERYNFIDRNKTRRIPAGRSVRKRLSRCEIAIVRRKGGYELVPAETATRIRERDERAVIGCGVAHDAGTTDGVPEDLMW